MTIVVDGLQCINAFEDIMSFESFEESVDI